ncbi:hypothetical protein BDY19DRAFT_918246 [Irpex rosettiformis]|uniref:Uncharacterized protein n=1 Tax=Irpex rosettiformis TaxID=378272 RepID=A0ACB8UHL4_9APHY|nr:hypothetical protein BDY19DRAFT_918246 [Irpex rosettiformis]
MEVRKPMKQNQLATDSSSKPSSSRPPTIRTSAAKSSASRVKVTGTFPSTMSSSQWDFEKIIQQGKNFKNIRRISAQLPEEEMARTIKEYDDSGEPLIIEGFHKSATWPQKVFDVDWLLEHYGEQMCCVRDVNKLSDHELSLSAFIDYARKPSSERQQALYYKDAYCPAEWTEWVKTKALIPSCLRPQSGNDLFRYLTPQESVESLMCYLGAGDTLTPCHKDLCGSSGHNIMCYTEDGGSSMWFMTATPDAPLVGRFFQEELHSEVDWERRTVTVEQFAKVPCTVYVAEQKLGDLVLVPPRSCHQVVNLGGLTIKTSWSRMTTKGLIMALRHELPIYRRVCRPEQYRVKYIIYRSMVQRQQELRELVDADDRRKVKQDDTSQMLVISEVKELVKDVASLVQLFDTILSEEFIPHETPTIFTHFQQINEILRPRHSSKRKPKPSSQATRVAATSCNFACDFCGSDIFQSFFECEKCMIYPSKDAEGPHTIGDGLILCCSCYVEGRTCACGSMKLAQCRPFSLLLQPRNDAAEVLRRFGEDYNKYFALNDKILLKIGQVRTSEAAYNLWKSRLPSLNSGKPELMCKLKHLVKRDHCVPCSTCRQSSCYVHLLERGIHSIEALIIRKPGASSWHSRHAGVHDTLQRGSIDVKEAESIEDPLKRQVMVVLIYPVCSSLNPGHTQPGWYDKLDPEAQAVDDRLDTCPDEDHRNDSELSVPGRDKGKAPLKRRDSISSLSSLSDAPSAPKRNFPLLSGKHVLMDCVLLPVPKRRIVHNSDSDRPIKRQKKGSKSVKNTSGDVTTPDSDEEDRRVEEDYADSLAQALSNVNKEHPSFSTTNAVLTLSKTRRTKYPGPSIETGAKAIASTANTSSSKTFPASSVAQMRAGLQAVQQSNSPSDATALRASKNPPPRTSVPFRAKRGRPPGRPNFLTGDPPGKQPEIGNARPSLQSPLRPPLDPSPPLVVPKASPSKPLSLAPGEKDPVETLKPTLHRFKNIIDDLSKSVQSLNGDLKTSQASYRTLEERFRNETRKKDEENQRILSKLSALTVELNTERAQRELLAQQLRMDLMKREQAIQDGARRVAEDAVKTWMEQSQKTHPGPSPPSTDESTQTMFKNFLAIIPQIMETMANSAGPSRAEPYNISSLVTSQPFFQAHLPSIRVQPNTWFEQTSTASNAYVREVQPSPVYYSQQVENFNVPQSRGRSPAHTTSVSNGNMVSRDPPSARRDLGNHSRTASDSHSQDNTITEETEDRYRRRTTRAPSRPRSDYQNTGTMDREGYRSTRDDETRRNGPTSNRHYSEDHQRRSERPSRDDHQQTKFTHRNDSSRSRHPASRPLRQ